MASRPPSLSRGPTESPHASLSPRNTIGTPGALQRVVDVRATRHERQEDDPGDPMAEQRVDPGDRDLLRALDVAEHRRVAEAECGAFDHLGHLRVVRVAQVAEQDAEHRGALLHELARDRVGLVVEALDRLQHPFAGAVRHLLHAAHHVGHRRLRHSGFRGDVEDGGRLAWRAGAPPVAGGTVSSPAPPERAAGSARGSAAAASALSTSQQPAAGPSLHGGEMITAACSASGGWAGLGPAVHRVHAHRLRRLTPFRADR